MPTSMANVTVHESCQDGQGYLGQLTKVAHPTFLAPLPIRPRIQGPRTSRPATRDSPPILVLKILVQKIDDGREFSVVI